MSMHLVRSSSAPKQVKGLTVLGANDLEPECEEASEAKTIKAMASLKGKESAL
jgi:hypothetical protein